MIEPGSRPVRQSIRINILRAASLITIPLIFFGKTPYTGESAFLEIIEVLGVFLVIGGVLGRFWSIIYVGGNKNKTVVDIGPYSMMRHPLYTFSIIGVLGFCLMLTSVVCVVVIGGLTTIILYETARREEIFLRSEFGHQYEKYAQRVPMIFPKFSAFKTPETIPVSIRHLRENFFDALVFLSLIPLAEFAEGVKESGVLPMFPLY